MQVQVFLTYPFQIPFLRLQVDKMGSDSESESDGGSTSASEDEGPDAGTAPKPFGRAANNKAKAAAFELMQGEQIMNPSSLLHKPVPQSVQKVFPLHGCSAH